MLYVGGSSSGLILIEKQRHLFRRANSFQIVFQFPGQRRWHVYGHFGGWNKQSQTASVICTDPAAGLMAQKDGRAEGRPNLITELQVLLCKMYLAGCIVGVDGNKAAD